jgi:hypothetical protein
MNKTDHAADTISATSSSGITSTWMRFWFEPASPRPLAVTRILTAALALLLLWSYAGDMQAWFGPQGMIPSGTVSAWRPQFGGSLFDVARTSGAVSGLCAATAVTFALLLVGLGTPLVSIAAAILWASLLHRGPMLAGPADDCLAVLLWCLAIGPSGAALSADRLIANLAGRAAAGPSVRARIALGLMQVHAAVIAGAAVLAQLKGDVWWDGTAAWWLAARPGSWLAAAAGILSRSDYALNAVTHAITGFEVAFAVGLWFVPTRTVVARLGLVAWPLIGGLVGEPFWGLAMAIFCVPLVREHREPARALEA